MSGAIDTLSQPVSRSDRQNESMTEKHRVELGTVQETMLLTLADRAAEASKKRPILVDPRALEIVESLDRPVALPRYVSTAITVLRTAIYDSWVRRFCAEHPAGTVVEIGTGLNTRFDRVDNGRVHWIDLDLPDSIELRRQFFTDTDRRRMLAASVLDEDWLDMVAALPGPYLFVAEGVLLYLPREDVNRTLAGIAARFPGASIAFDTYRRWALRQQHRMADKGRMDARWSWFCEDPHEFESLGLTLVASITVARPPRDVRDRLPLGYRLTLPLLRPLLDATFRLNMFRVPEQLVND